MWQCGTFVNHMHVRSLKHWRVKGLFSSPPPPPFQPPSPPRAIQEQRRVDSDLSFTSQPYCQPPAMSSSTNGFTADALQTHEYQASQPAVTPDIE